MLRTSLSNSKTAFLGLSLHSHQFVAEAAMTKAVVNSEFASCEAFADLPIDPEFVTIPAQTGRIAGVVEIEEVPAQLGRYGTGRNFGDGTLPEALLTGEHVLHPAERRAP